MKKFIQTNKRMQCIALTAALGMTLMLTGCGSSKNITLYGSEEEYGTVTLGEYKGLSAKKKVYEVSDETINSEMEYALYDYTEYKSVDRAAKEEDFLTLNLKATADGNVVLDSSQEESGVFETQLGYEDYGAEFDENLLGAKKGDHLTFSIEYDADFDFEDLAGKKVDFDVTVNEISEEIVPELTEDFIKNTLGYDSEEAWKNEIKDNLNKQYEDNSKYSLYYDLIGQVVANSTVTKYSDDLFNACYSSVEQNYMSYMEMLGCETLDEVFTAFGITEDDLKQEAIDQVNQEVVVNAIATAENMVISKGDYDKKLESLAEEYEYENTKDLIADIGDKDLKYMIMEEKVFELLADNAQLTEVKVDPAMEEANEFEESDESDDEIDMEDEIDFEDSDEIDDLESLDEIDADDDSDVDEEEADADDASDDDDEADADDSADDDDEADADDSADNDADDSADDSSDDDDSTGDVTDDSDVDEVPVEANTAGETEITVQ